MKKTLLLSLLLALSVHVSAQDPAGEKLKQELLAHPQQDTFRVNRLNEMVFFSRDEIYYKEALAISQKIGYAMGEAYALTHKAFSKFITNYRKEGDSLFRRADSIATKTTNPDLIATVQVYRAYAGIFEDSKKAFLLLLEAEKTTERSGNKKLLAICQHFIAIQYANGESNIPKGMEYYLKSIHTAEKINFLRIICAGNIAMGGLYNRMDDKANAILYFQQAKEINKQLKNPTYEGRFLIFEGNGYKKEGKYAKAIDIFKKILSNINNTDSGLIASAQLNLAETYTLTDSLPFAFAHSASVVNYAKRRGDNLLYAMAMVPFSETYLKNSMPDSAVYYAKLGYDYAKQIGTIAVMRDNAEILAKAYAYKKDFANAYSYQLLYNNHRDSVLNTEIRNKSAVVQYNTDLEKKQTQITTLNEQKKVQQNYLYGVLAVLLLIIITAFILLKSNRQKQKANKLLQKQKLQIEDQRDQTNNALLHLQQTQAQLIQSEKMASLGELTAGIAHEIQNPLNFVNNFSEVNKELLVEMKEEVEKGNMDEVKAIANDVIDNEEKINHHGKRADAIVKGMLQHSRSSSGVKESTDINALADEYLRLAYHGLRAKDKNFNATLKTEFDESIGNINIIPQDIGRVILNLITNAFYATNEKAKLDFDIYEPTVMVTTSKIIKGNGGNARVEICVADNGNGIPQKVLDKIFQPFFTTKPTGQGTGLGLSLSYDIVKAHGGELKVETKEGEGAAFIIQLPV
jgi:signal transduction histidine kinase